MATVNLQADLSVVGVAKVEAALSSLQSKFRALNKVASEGAKSAKASGANERSLEAAKIRAEQRVAAAAMKEENKRSAAVMRNIQKEEQAKIRAEQRWQNMAAAQRRKAYAEEQRNMRRLESSARRESSQREAANKKFSSGLISGAASKAGGVIKGIGAGLVGSVTGIAALGVNERIQAGTKATQLAIVGKQGGDKRSIADIRKEILGASENTSKSLGIGTSEVVDFLSAFQGKAGVLSTGKEQEKLLNQILPEGIKTGADTQTLGSVAGQVYKSFEGEGSEKAMEKARAATRFFAKSAAAGSIELPDIAAELPKLLATASQTGDFEENLKNAVAIAQFSNVEGGGAANAAEAGTAVARLGSDVIGNQKKFKAMGINAIDEKGNLTNLQDLIMQTLDKTGGDVTKLNELFGERSIKAISNPAKAYRDTFRQAKEAGKSDKEAKAIALDAIKKQFDAITKVTTDQKEANKETEEYVKDEAIKLKKAMNDLQIAFARDLVPVLINDLMPAFMELAPHLKAAVKLFSQIASWAGKNPLLAVGAAISAAAVQSVVSASIGTAISTAVTASISSAGIGAAITAAMPAVLIAAGAAIAIAVKTGIDNFFDKKGKKEFEKGKLEKDFGKGGTLDQLESKQNRTPEEDYKLQMLRIQKAKILSQPVIDKGKLGAYGVLDDFTGGIVSALNPYDTGRNTRIQNEATSNALNELRGGPTTNDSLFGGLGVVSPVFEVFDLFSQAGPVVQNLVTSFEALDAKAKSVATNLPAGTRAPK